MTQIFVLMVVSAVVAYLGDLLGTYVGKQRLTVLGLRPRTTAILVAITTGIFITLLTLGVAAILSNNVWIALFEVQKLKDDQVALGKDVDRLKQERDRLQAETRSLQDRVRIKEQESVAFQKNEPLVVVVIQGGRAVASISAELSDFISRVVARARAGGLVVKAETSFFEGNKESLDRLATMIATSTEEMVVGAVAAENINVGESLGQVKFMVGPNSLIFQAGQEIARVEIDGSLARGEIARRLQEFMEEINQEVVRQGMVGNPLTKRFGDLSSESMLSFFDMVNQVRSFGRKLNVVAVVKEDTYAMGPLNFTFRLEEETD